jgi:hypothetical protein
MTRLNADAPDLIELQRAKFQDSLQDGRRTTNAGLRKIPLSLRQGNFFAQQSNGSKDWAGGTGTD